MIDCLGTCRPARARSRFAIGDRVSRFVRCHHRQRRHRTAQLLPAVRPLRMRSSPGSDTAQAEVLDLEVVLDPVLGAFAAQARGLDAAERRHFVGDQAGVDADHAVLQLLGDAEHAGQVAGVEVGRQAELGVVGLTGITLTKLDGTAKGGVIFSVADQFGIPIRYIGVGERIEDLRPFKADDFIEALFARED